MTTKTRATQLFDCADVGGTLVSPGRNEREPRNQTQSPWSGSGTDCLASANIRVGQVARILVVSELQAIGSGVPTVVADQIQGYSDDVEPAHIQRVDVFQEMSESIEDPLMLSAKIEGPGCFLRSHAVSVLLARIEVGYVKTLGAA